MTIAELVSDLAAALDPVVLAQQAGLDPDPWQADVLRSTALRVLLNCSRQSGKSTVSALLALHTALYTPAALVLMLSPSLRQSAELFRKGLDLYRALGRPVPAQAETSLRLDHAVTITGGDSVMRESSYHVRVPKRELVGLLVALFQSGRLKVARDLELAPALLDELLNFRVKVNLQTAHDSYEAWRESAHDDLVLATALACWHAENAPRPARIIWSDEYDVYEGGTPAVSPHYWRTGR